MAKFFNQLQEHELVTEWVDLLDWLLDDRRFDKNDGWESDIKKRFTRRIKKQPNVSDGKNFIVKANKDLTWNKRPSNLFIQFQSGGSIGEDLIKHIRNGIAHGRTNIKPKDGSPWIEIKDYNSQKQQTAYLFIPINFIKELYKVYKEIENSVNPNKKTSKQKPNNRTTKTKQKKAS